MRELVKMRIDGQFDARRERGCARALASLYIAGRFG
jgi:hypothetical protein